MYKGARSAAEVVLSLDAINQIAHSTKEKKKRQKMKRQPEAGFPTNYVAGTQNQSAPNLYRPCHVMPFRMSRPVRTRLQERKKEKRRYTFFSDFAGTKHSNMMHVIEGFLARIRHCPEDGEGAGQEDWIASGAKVWYWNGSGRANALLEF